MISLGKALFSIWKTIRIDTLPSMVRTFPSMAIERDKPVYVNCQTGLRSYLACRLLMQYGFTCAHLSGGYSFYQVVTQERQTAQSAYPCGMEKL